MDEVYQARNGSVVRGGGELREDKRRFQGSFIQGTPTTNSLQPMSFKSDTRRIVGTGTLDIFLSQFTVMVAPTLIVPALHEASWSILHESVLESKVEQAG